MMLIDIEADELSIADETGTRTPDPWSNKHAM
jgi:hypothetical protein